MQKELQSPSNNLDALAFFATEEYKSLANSPIDRRSPRFGYDDFLRSPMIGISPFSPGIINNVLLTPRLPTFHSVPTQMPISPPQTMVQPAYIVQPVARYGFPMFQQQQQQPQQLQLQLQPQQQALSNFKVAIPKMMLNSVGQKNVALKSFKCDYEGCTYSSTKKTEINDHVRIRHTLSFEPFRCKYDGCRKEYSRLKGLKNHIRKKKHFLNNEDIVTDTNEQQ
jgi:hypothetical protein